MSRSVSEIPNCSLATRRIVSASKRVFVIGMVVSSSLWFPVRKRYRFTRRDGQSRSWQHCASSGHRAQQETKAICKGCAGASHTSIGNGRTTDELIK